MTAETARQINSELVSQMSRKLDEIKFTDLNSLIPQAKYSAIAEKVLPHLQNSLGELENGLSAKMDLRSSPTVEHRNTAN